MATHSSILAWRIPWTEEPGGLHSSWGLKELDTTEWLTHAQFFNNLEFPEKLLADANISSYLAEKISHYK